MTQVQTMTNPELNRALAELMGYSVSSEQGRGYGLKNPAGVIIADPFSRNTEEIAWSWAPNYCSSPAASLEVQTAAIAINKLVYLNKLLSMVSPSDDIQFGLGGTMEVVGYNIDGTAAMLSATPRERAEAAYITLQGVKKDAK